MKAERAPGHIGHRKRIRGKYLKTGFAGWNDYEILELLLTYSVPRRDTKPLAKKLISDFGSISGVFSADSDGLMAAGLSVTTAAFLQLLKDFAKLYTKLAIKETDLLSAPSKVFDYLKNNMKFSKDEELLALFLNSSNHIITEELISKGVPDKAVTAPRKIAELALKHKSTGVIIAHNHPGGSPAPSPNDIEATKAVRSALDAVGIELLDHIIISNNSYLSFKEKSII